MSLEKTFCVLVLSGPLKSQRFYVKSNVPVLIGKIDYAVIKIDLDEFCSRKHAAIYFNKEECVLEDLGSTNGTFLNDVRINGKVKLKNKDIVRVGSTNMQIVISNDQESAENDCFKKKQTLIKKGGVIGGFLEVIDMCEGGIGVVYVCLDRKHSALFALKTFKTELSISETQEALFKKEALVWIRLGKHPYIVQAISVENFELRIYIVLEFIAPDKDGRNTLRHYLGCLSLPEILKFSIQFCDGMEYAYSKGIDAHRDIKPDNIMVEAGMIIKITDFGIAKSLQVLNKEADTHNTDLSQDLRVFETKIGKICGTLPYMAPEQFEAKVDKRSDIYAFGVVLFQMAIGGQLPFVGKDFDEYEKFHKEAKLPKVDSPLFPIIRKCLEKKPDNRYQDFLEIREALNDILVQEGYAKVSASVSSDLDYRDLTNKGDSLDSLGQYEEAIKNYERALEINPEYARAWLNKGSALGRLGEFNEAFACFDKAIEIYPLGYENWYIKGQWLLRLERNSEALECFDKALEINPDYAAAWDDKGAVLWKSGKPQDAIMCYDKAIQINPQNALAWLQKGRILSELKVRPWVFEVLRCIDKALEINSEYIQKKFPDVWLLKGSLLKSIGKQKEAISCLDRGLKYSDDINLYMIKGDILKRLGRYNEAILCYDKVLEKNTKSIEGWHNKGAALMAINKFIEALDCLNNALELDPTNIEQCNDKGVILINLGKFEEAITCFDYSLKMDKKNSRAWGLKGLVLLTTTSLLPKDKQESSYKKVLQYLEEGLQIIPNDEVLNKMKKEILNGLRNNQYP